MHCRENECISVDHAKIGKQRAHLPLLRTINHDNMNLKYLYKMHTSIFKKFNFVLGLAMFLLVATGCDSNDSDDDAVEADIVQVATDAGFDTLVAAVQAAELVETLQGAGPFTVFAPTDAAFANLPAGTLDDLLLPENKETLQAILTYHVVAGAVTADQVVNLTTATTVQGEAIDITVENGDVFLNGVRVSQTDVTASNGVIHIIDGVLLPPSTQQ